jgi:hypothetical protein
VCPHIDLTCNIFSTTGRKLLHDREYKECIRLMEATMIRAKEDHPNQVEYARTLRAKAIRFGKP